MESRKRQRASSTSEEVIIQTTTPRLNALPAVFQITKAKRLRSTLIKVFQEYPEAGEAVFKELMLCYEVRSNEKIKLLEAKKEDEKKKKKEAKEDASQDRKVNRWVDRHNRRVEAGEEDQAEMDRKVDEDDWSVSSGPISERSSDSDTTDLESESSSNDYRPRAISIKPSEYRELITDDDKIGKSTRFASRFEVCENCNCEFDVTKNEKVCEIHRGKKIDKNNEHRGQRAYYECCPHDDADAWDNQPCRRTWHSVKGALLQAKYC